MDLHSYMVFKFLIFNEKNQRNMFLLSSFKKMMFVHT